MLSECYFVFSVISAQLNTSSFSQLPLPTNAQFSLIPSHTKKGDIEGVQDEAPQNVPLWDKDYFKLKVIKHSLPLP